MLNSDLAMFTLEGVAEDNQRFSSVLNEVHSAGVNVMNIGTSYILDTGMSGLSRTTDILRRNGITPVGAYRTADEARNLNIQRISGHSIAFLSYAQEISIDGIANTTEADRAFALKMLDPDVVMQDVRRARNLGAELVIVSVNWADGPLGYLIDQIVQSGADIIVGSHPEIVEPLALRPVRLSDGTAHTVLVATSLGNALAGESLSASNTAGTLLSLTYVKDTYTNRMRLETYRQYMPTWLAKDEVSGVHQLLPAGLRNKPTWMDSATYGTMHEAYNSQVNRLGYSVATPVAE